MYSSIEFFGRVRFGLGDLPHEDFNNFVALRLFELVEERADRRRQQDALRLWALPAGPQAEGRPLRRPGAASVLQLRAADATDAAAAAAIETAAI